MESPKYFDNTEDEKVIEVQGRVQGKAGSILQKVLETGEPFFIVRAQDIFTPMIVRRYMQLIEEYAPYDIEFQQSLAKALHEIQAWQRTHIGQVRYPD